MQIETATEKTDGERAPLLFPNARRSRVAYPPLPEDHTSLIGRERELESLAALLETPGIRLITITGTGGVGKTRLAVEAVRRLTVRTSLKAAFIPLSHIESAELVPPAIAAALRIARTGYGSLLDQIAEGLSAEPAVLLLDNFEQIIDASSFVSILLKLCPNLTIIVTSRTRLRLRGERELKLGPLATSASTPDAPAPSVELFMSRLASANPSTVFSPERLVQFAELCQKLDGIPLAIELAAARGRVLTSDRMLAMLDRSLHLLMGGPRDAPARHQTMRDTILWTYELLPASIQRYFRYLALFPGGFNLESASLVAAHLNLSASGEDALDPVAGLETFLDNSLLSGDHADPNPDLPHRYSFFETIRAFGLEELDRRSETQDAYEVLDAWCRGLAAKTAGATRGAGFGEFRDLEAEYPNVRAALVWHRDRGQARRALEILQPLAWFMTQRFLLDDAIGWSNTFLAMPDARSDLAAYARSLNAASQIEYWHNGLQRSLDLSSEALAIWRTLEQPAEIANALIETARAGFDLDGSEAAVAALSEALQILETFGDKLNQAIAHALYGRIEIDHEQFAESHAHYERAIDLFQQTGHTTWLALAYDGFGLLLVVTGELDQAEAIYQRALNLAITVHDYWRQASCAYGLAEIARQRGGLDRAALLFAGSGAARIELDIALRPSTQRWVDAWVAELETSLGKARFADLWAAGFAMSRDETALLALEPDTSSQTVPENPTPKAVLPAALRELGVTPREYEIFRLLCEGLSNKEIGERLEIGARTAMQHIANIFPKIGVSSRAQAVSWGLRNGLG